MKTFFLLSLLFLVSIISFAQFTGDGYFRIRNVGSERYIVITDNKGSVNVGSMSADLGAVKLYRSFENVVSNPGSVLYVNEVNGLYRFESQGTDTHEIIGYDLKLKKNSDGSYKAYQEKGTRLFLCDARKENTEEGVLSTRSEENNYRDWELLPLSANSSNYFGITPEINIGNDYYATLYASFPFTFYSEGMQAYYISTVDENIAVLSEVEDNIVPASMPVIIRCSSPEPELNKLEVDANIAAEKPSVNKLLGVYFKNTSKAHYNSTPYDSETMRVLGTTSDGSLGFIKADIELLPANKAYLTVPSDTPDELVLMSEEEYDNYKTGIIDIKDSMTKNPSALVDVYTLQGIRVKSQVRFNTLQSTLPEGIYVVNGRKIIVR